ncbi:MAG: DUF6056 family protein [Lachnospiraceae bacterium]
MIKKLKEKFDYRFIPMIALWWVFLQQFWPLLSISRYNHSNADDYWMSSHVHFEWVDTHSFFKTVAMAWKCAVNLWKNWDGCLFSMFIGSMPPVVFHEDYNKFTFSILAGALIICFLAFLFVLLVRVCKMDWVSFALVSPVFLIVLTSMLPSIKDAFFWWVGGINYTLFSAIFFLAQAFVLEYVVSERIPFLIIGSVLSFMVGPGNLLSGLLNPEVLVLECVVWLYIKKKKGSLKKGLLFLIPTFSGIAGLMLNVLAPGNLIRGGDGLFSSSITGAIWGTIVASTNFIKIFYTPSMFCMLLLLIVIVFLGMKKEKLQYTFKYPFLFLIVTYLVYCSVFTPVIFADSAYYGRCLNVSFFVFVAFVLINIIYFIGWIKQRRTVVISKGVSMTMVLTTSVLVLWATHYFYPYYDSALAAESLRCGQAQDFDAKVDARYEQYYDPSVKDVIIEPIDWIPSIFYFDDDCLPNLEFYFEKDSIRYPDGYEQP